MSGRHCQKCSIRISGFLGFIHTTIGADQVSRAARRKDVHHLSFDDRVGDVADEYSLARQLGQRQLPMGERHARRHPIK